MDAETGFYYYGARYLDPKTSRWISADPALGKYVPVAPVDDEAKKRNGNLPGQGGVFNYVNLHVYHYAGNNPIKYIDPDGMKYRWVHTTHKVNNDGKKISEYRVVEVSKDSDQDAYKVHGEARKNVKEYEVDKKPRIHKMYDVGNEIIIEEEKSPDGSRTVHEWSVFDTEDSQDINSKKYDKNGKLVVIRINIFTGIRGVSKLKDVEMLSIYEEQRKRLTED